MTLPLTKAVAVIWTGFCPGSVAGAVYSPAEVIFPATVFPPTTPPADQVSVGLETPVVAAEN